MNPQIPDKYNASFHKYYRQIKPTLEKPKVRIYTTIIFSFLAISLFGWYAIRPTLQTIIYLNREIKDKSELNTKLEQKIASLIEAQAAYQDAQPLLLLLDEAIPVLPDALDLTAQLRNITFSHEATYSSMSVGNIPLAKKETKQKTVAAAQASATDSFNESIVLSGDFVNLEKVIADIHNMRRLATLKSIGLSPTDNEKPSSRSAQLLQLEMNSAVESYYHN